MKLGRRLRAWFTTPSAQFSESAPRPIADMFAEMYNSAGRVGRTEALSVPAVLKGRNLICAIATLPLVQYGPDNQPARNVFLEQIDPDIANIVTMSMTTEDLLFEGIAWWRITAFGWDGFPANARRLDPDTVTVNPPGGRDTSPLPSGIDPREGVVWVDGKPVPESQMIRFDSPSPALLVAGARAIRRAILLDKAEMLYAKDPRPLDYFTPAENAPDADDDAVQDALSNWGSFRRTRSTGFVPEWLEYHEVSTPTPQQMQLVELKKQAWLEIANAIGVDPYELGLPVASTPYSNVQDRRKDKINDVLAPFMRAITDRLSMPDVTKRGYAVRFDLNDYMKANATERANVQKTYKDMGVMDADEIREAEGMPGPAPKPAQEPATAPAEEPAPEPEGADAAAAPGHTFDGPSTLTFDMEVTGFSVDRESRVIEGLALPYGRVAGKGGLKYKFAKDSLQWGEVSRVKMLRDHDSTQLLGKALKLANTPAGLQVRFSVARGAEGDRALELAEDGVLDGMSVGVDFDFTADTEQDSRDKSVTLVRRADLREVSLTAMPAFDDARVTKVAASRDGEGAGMPEQTEPEVQATTTPPATGGVTLSEEQFQALLSRGNTSQEPAEGRQFVSATRRTATTAVNEGLPYRFDRSGKNFEPRQVHDFATDVVTMLKRRDFDGDQTDAGRRVVAFMGAQFAVSTGNVDETTPVIQRPDMYVDQREYRTPLWNFVNKGAPPNGVQPFTFPKYNTSSGLVGDHTEGTEPTGGGFTTTGQTVTPTALSGKAYINREVWDMGGNPAVSTLIWNQMVRGYREGLESATATFLNTLTAATDITIPAGASDETLAAAWEAALADLQFIRGFDFEAFALEKELYKKFAAARDTSERPLYPILNPMNANGQARTRFQTLDLAGVTGVPSWALASTAGSPNNSWLFDPSVVWGWATAPQRLEFDGASDDNTTVAPVAKIGIGIWGYKAFANTDIGGVRQVIYDTVP
jgi:HK97 family phage prohead protease